MQFSVDLTTLAVMALTALLVGLILGVSLGRPRY